MKLLDFLFRRSRLSTRVAEKGITIDHSRGTALVPDKATRGEMHAAAELAGLALPIRGSVRAIAKSFAVDGEWFSAYWSDGDYHWFDRTGRLHLWRSGSIRSRRYAINLAFPEVPWGCRGLEPPMNYAEQSLLEAIYAAELRRRRDRQQADANDALTEIVQRFP